MNMQYRCLCLSGEDSQDILQRGSEEFGRRTRGRVLWETFDRREDLLYRIRRGDYDAVVVAMPGALGMETALGVRAQDAAVPLVWISNDEVFALESYRLRANAFLCTPITEAQIADVLLRCLSKQLS